MGKHTCANFHALVNTTKSRTDKNGLAIHLETSAGEQSLAIPKVSNSPL
jgi:hypothetical protein